MRIGRRSTHSLLAATIGIFIAVIYVGCGDDDNPTGRDSLLLPEKVVAIPGDHPTLSPDHQWLAFALPQGGVVKCLLRTGAIDTLTTFGFEPVWSPVSDNILILDRRFDTRYLATVSAATGDTAAIRGGGFLDGAVWAPDGNEIVAHASDGLVTITYPAGDIAAVSCGDPDYSTCAGITPCWSPDGNWIAFRDGARLLRVPKTGGRAEVILEVANEIINPRYSPDGRWIVYAMQEAGSTDWRLWAIDISGGNREPRRITGTDSTCHSGTCSDFDPYWSPDGRQIYFSSTRSGQKAIWRIGFKS
jgi:dipeptidyl aminopeptidase/acylaminoacyl peptidase